MTGTPAGFRPQRETYFFAANRNPASFKLIVRSQLCVAPRNMSAQQSVWLLAHERSALTRSRLEVVATTPRTSALYAASALSGALKQASPTKHAPIAEG